MEIKDTFFFNIDQAYAEAVKQNTLVEQGKSRIQYCYYDGDLSAFALENFICVAKDDFVDFFANNQLPLPELIIDEQGNNIIVRKQLTEIVSEIESFRDKQTVKNYIHQDTDFFNTLEALNTAKQKNRVRCGDSLDGLQICYYHGEVIESDLINLIHVEIDNLLPFFTYTCLRLPQALRANPELSEDYQNVLQQVDHDRAEIAEQLKQQALQIIPDFTTHPLTVLLIASRFAYQACDDQIENISDDLVLVLEKAGYQVLLYKESTEMEILNEVDLLQQYIAHKPQIIINFNRLHNNFCHPDVVNISVWTTLPWSLEIAENLSFRQNDFNLVNVDKTRRQLKRVGAKNIFEMESDAFPALFNHFNEELPVYAEIELNKNIRLIAECADVHKQYLLTNLATLKKHHHELHQQVTQWLDRHKVNIETGHECEGIMRYIHTIVDGKTAFTLNNELLLNNQIMINANDARSIYILSGIGSGYELQWIWQQTAKPYLYIKSQMPVYLILNSWAQFITSCILQDLTNELTGTRLRLFVGENACSHLRDELQPAYAPLPAYMINTSVREEQAYIEIQDIVRAIKQSRQNKYELDKTDVAKYYQSFSKQQWIERFSAKNLSELKIIGIAPRFSTFVKYCMRDLLDGFSRMGSVTYIYGEKEDYQQNCNEQLLSEINRIKPDLILCIDHFRHERTGVPNSLPWVNWIQDMLPNISENKHVMGLADFTYVFAKNWLGLGKSPEYKDFSVNFLPLGVNDELYRPIPFDSYSCDVLFVTHLIDPGLTLAPLRDPETYQICWTQKERDFLRQNRVTEQQLALMYQSIEKYISPMGMVEYSHFFLSGPASKQIIQKLVETIGGYSDAILELLIGIVGNRLHYEGLLRLKLWPVETLVQQRPQYKIHVYGNNWQHFPEVKIAWQGVAENGENLNTLMNQAKICLNASPGVSMHMRALESMAAGAFMLSRKIQGDGSPLSDFFAEDEIALFVDENDLIQQVDYFLLHEDKRKITAEKARESVLQQFSYTSIAGQIHSDVAKRFKQTLC